ncbi:MAG: carboxypeptidase M32 [Saprospiraceae bacterium]
MSAPYNNYVKHLQKLADVENAINVLAWDKEINLPTNGAHFRAQQIATLSGIAHEIQTAPSFENNLTSLLADVDQLQPAQAKNVQLSKRQLDRSNKLDKDFVVRRSQVSSKAYHAWLDARKANDFSLYYEPLAALVELKKEEAQRLGYEGHPYDALMEEYEPGATTKDIDQLFAEVKTQLSDFAKKIRNLNPVDDQFLQQHFPKDQQWEWGLALLKNMGYDFSSGRQDLSPHPFTTNFSPQDVRVTTRVDENNLSNMAWSCIHEGGHALYEQGLPVENYGLPLGKYISLGIHESQSRLWENNVGRSFAYWQAHYSDLQRRFPDQLGKISVETFYRGINRVQAGRIRTESDEIHYHFHIMIRYEIEKALIEGSLQTKDLKAIWKEQYQRYLNVTVTDDNQGILQDIHWAIGSFGYFPTYSLGSIYAAQFFQQATKDIPNLNAQIQKGENQQLLQWLRENIHQHGRRYNAQELCIKLTGEKLNFKYFMAYAEDKYKGIYEGL